MIRGGDDVEIRIDNTQPFNPCVTITIYGVNNS